MKNGTLVRSSSDLRSSAAAIPAWCSRSAPSGWPVRTRPIVSCRRSSWSSCSSPRGSVSAASQMPASEAAAVSVPVLLEVAHEGGAEVAIGLLARVGGHVLAEQVERLLAGPDRAAVRRGVDQPRAGQRGYALLDRLVDLFGVYYLVADLLCVGLAGSPGAAGEDRLARRAVAHGSPQAKVGSAGNDP